MERTNIIIPTDKTFPDAIKNLQAIAYTYINEGTLSISTSKLLLQHVTSTLFAHFKLYQVTQIFIESCIA